MMKDIIVNNYRYDYQKVLGMNNLMIFTKNLIPNVKNVQHMIKVNLNCRVAYIK